ncbi:MAG: FapA family protein [Fibromonadaceae bacterium]|jgi:uncharacterized protein (DUF342 family)|nr:FapA family protein [Fibromonadaceae bacterium]
MRNQNLTGVRESELFEEEKRKFMHLHVTPIQARFSMDVGLIEAGLRITKEDIYFILAEKAVVYGIHPNIIEDMISNDAYGREFVIASADSPVLGQDAIITEAIPIDPDVKPFLDENGNANYKTWDNIRQVKKGEVICTRTPPTPGIPGTSVFGQPLSPIPGEDFALPIGMNTQVIDDETKLVATIDGYLYRAGRNICVGNIYVIKGDIDIKTGNIEYSGDVVIKGNVNAGFSVVADGNISIEGFVEAAHIESKKNSVFLKGSVFGLNKATIYAAKNITAKSIQDACIKAGKTLTVVNLIRGCEIETENLEMPRSTGQIISSKVTFKGYVKCGVIGGKTESINEFILSEDERKQFREELKKANLLLQRLDKAIEVLQAKLVSMSPIRITSELEEQKKLFNSQLSTCKSNKEQLTAKRKSLIKLIEIMPDKDDLIVVKQLSPILKLSAFGLSKEYKQELSYLKIGWKNGNFKMEST